MFLLSRPLDPAILQDTPPPPSYPMPEAHSPGRNSSVLHGELGPMTSGFDSPQRAGSQASQLASCWARPPGPHTEVAWLGPGLLASLSVVWGI